MEPRRLAARRAARSGTRASCQALAFSPQATCWRRPAATARYALWNLDGKPRGAALRFGKGDGILQQIGRSRSRPDGDVFALGAAPFQLLDQNRLLWERPLRTRRLADSGIAFSPRGDFIVTGSALGDIQVWNRDGSTRVGPLKQNTEYISALAMAPDGDYFAAVVGAVRPSRSSISMARRVARRWRHFGAIRALAFSPPDASRPAATTARSAVDAAIGEVETIDVGLPIAQLGFRGDVLWVRANESVFFYAPNRKVAGTMLLRRDAALAYTPDGWYAGSDQFDVRLFDAAGQPLTEARRSHASPDRVLQAIAGPARTENAQRASMSNTV